MFCSSQQGRSGPGLREPKRAPPVAEGDQWYVRSSRRKRTGLRSTRGRNDWY